MPGSVHIIDTQTALSSSLTVSLPDSMSAHSTAVFLVAVSSVSGTWEVSFEWRRGGQTLQLAAATGITAIGHVKAALVSTLVGVKDCIMRPTHIVYTEVLPGSITCEAIGIYGN